MQDFGRYQVLEQVAAGATGTVYKARDPEVGRLVAIKELHPALRSAPGMADRLRAEARLLGTLQSPHVVAVYEYVEDPQRSWIVEEWVKGVSLAALLAEHGQLTAEQSLGVLRGALTGLADAHDRDLVHRDISSGNVLADMAGTSKLIDFGLAAPTGVGGAVGTPAFTSPEAARGEPVGKPGDVYSAGALLFLLLTGSPVFRAADARSVLRAHIEDEPPPLSGHGPRLADLVRRALSKLPAARPPDARALLLELEEGAKERYGATWLERSSIAGLVAAAVGAASAAAGGGAAAGSAETVVVGAAGGIDTGLLPKAVAKRATRVGLVGAVAAGAVVVAAVAAVAVTRHSSGSSNAKSNRAATGAAARAAAASASPRLSDAELTASAPTGVYRVQARILSTSFIDEKVGATSTSQLTISLTCAAGSCRGTARSNNKLLYQATFDGTTLLLSLTGTSEGPCANNDGSLGGSQDRGTVRYELAGSLTPTVPNSRPTAPPTQLTGRVTLVNTAIAVTGKCVIAPPKHSESELTLTKVG